MAYVVEKAGLHYAVSLRGREPDYRRGAAAMAPLWRPGRRPGARLPAQRAESSS